MWTTPPILSTSEESSVPTKPSNMAVEYALRRMVERKTWGVWAIQNMLRSGVPTMFAESTTLRVSTEGCPTTTPSMSWSPLSMQIERLMRSMVTRGRAPSWMAMISKRGSTASTPFMADSWRMSPDEAKVMGVVKP